MVYQASLHRNISYLLHKPSPLPLRKITCRARHKRQIGGSIRPHEPSSIPTTTTAAAAIPSPTAICSYPAICFTTRNTVYTHTTSSANLLPSSPTTILYASSTISSSSRARLPASATRSCVSPGARGGPYAKPPYYWSPVDGMRGG